MSFLNAGVIERPPTPTKEDLRRTAEEELSRARESQQGERLRQRKRGASQLTTSAIGNLFPTRVI